MPIDGETLSTIKTQLTNINTTEANARDALNHMANELDGVESRANGINEPFPMGVSGIRIGSATPATKALQVDGEFEVSDKSTLEELQVTADAQFDADVTIGNASSDTLVINARLNSVLEPETTTLDIGTSTNRFDDVFCQRINTRLGGTIGENVNQTVTINARIESSLIPATPSRYACGTILHPWQEVFTNTLTCNQTSIFTGTAEFRGAINANGTVNLGNATSDTINFIGRAGRDLIPSTDEAYDLGSATHQWNLYAADAVFTGDADFTNATVLGLSGTGGGNFTFHEAVTTSNLNYAVPTGATSLLFVLVGGGATFFGIFPSDFSSNTTAAGPGSVAHYMVTNLTNVRIMQIHIGSRGTNVGSGGNGSGTTVRLVEGAGTGNYTELEAWGGLQYAVSGSQQVRGRSLGAAPFYRLSSGSFVDSGVRTLGSVTAQASHFGVQQTIIPLRRIQYFRSGEARAENVNEIYGIHVDGVRRGHAVDGTSTAVDI